jgi:hypothetical protein
MFLTTGTAASLPIITEKSETLTIFPELITILFVI